MLVKRTGMQNHRLILQANLIGQSHKINLFEKAIQPTLSVYSKMRKPFSAFSGILWNELVYFREQRVIS